MKRSELFFTFILLPLDIAMTILSFVFAYHLRNRLEIGDVQFTAALSDYVTLSLYLIPALVVVYALNGLYYVKSRKALPAELYRIVESNSALIALLVLVLFFSKTSSFSRLIILFTWFLGIVMVSAARITVRIIQKMLIKNGIGRRNLLVIGSNGVASFIASEINKNIWSEYKFCGVLSPENNKDIRVLGQPQDFVDICQKYKIDEIIVIENKITRALFNEIIDYCSLSHLGLKFVPGIVADYSLKLENTSIGSMPVLEIKMHALDGWGRIIKRLIDIILSAFLILIFSPLILLIALIQKITSPGSILYSHERIGLDGKPFVLYKFRSMYQNSEQNEGRYWTEKNDSRITPFGKILRASNLDELPQLFNIINGDMSFVGPRPEQPIFVEKFSKEIPGYQKRHRIKSGLTGWAQVNGLKGDTSISERVRFDTFYIENWSVLFDLKIVLKTIWLIFYELFRGKYEYRHNS